MGRLSVVVVVLLCFALTSASGGAQSVRPTCFGMLATLVGGEGGDVMEGTSGPDVIATLGGDDHVEGGGGDDRICTGAGDDTFLGGGGDDRLNGGADEDVLAGGSGDDLIVGGAGGDSVSFQFAAGPVNVDLERGVADGEGSDTLQELENAVGSPFGDRFVGNAEINVFIGDAGSDRMDGGPHADAYVGGPGDDELVGRTGDGDTAAYLTAPGPMTIDLARGTALGDGTDILVQIDDALGSNHDDVLIGDERMNFLIGGRGNDELRAGTGFDVAVFLNGPVTAQLFRGTATGEGTDRLVGFEGLAGTEVNDRLFGSGGQNYLEGRGGDDVLDAGAGADVMLGKQGADVLRAGAGDDKLFGGPGDDSLTGGAGTGDTVSYIDSPAAVQVDLAARRATGEGADRLDGIEGVSGSLLPDELRGDRRANALFGNAGDDVLVGGAGSDFLGGGEGTNRLVPGGGTDYCLERPTTGRCEITGVPSIPGAPNQPPLEPSPYRASASVAAAPSRALPPATRVDRLRWLARAVERLDAISDSFARARVVPARLRVGAPAPRGVARTAQVRTTAEYEYGAEPVCIVQRGRRVTEIAPPKLVRPVGDDGRAEEAWWQGTLHRVGTRRVLRRTPWARAQLAGGFVVPGVLIWRDATNARAFRSPVRVNLQRGRYVWRGHIYWVRSGGRIFAPIEPHIIRTRTIRHNKFCDFR